MEHAIGFVRIKRDGNGEHDELFNMSKVMGHETHKLEYKSGTHVCINVIVTM